MSKRQAIYKQISDQLVDNAVWVWMFTPQSFLAVNTSVKGFPVRLSGDLTTLWKASIS